MLEDLQQQQTPSNTKVIAVAKLGGDDLEDPAVVTIEDVEEGGTGDSESSAFMIATPEEKHEELDSLPPQEHTDTSHQPRIHLPAETSTAPPPTGVILPRPREDTNTRTGQDAESLSTHRDETSDTSSGNRTEASGGPQKDVLTITSSVALGSDAGDDEQQAVPPTSAPPSSDSGTASGRPSNRDSNQNLAWPHRCA